MNFYIVSNAESMSEDYPYIKPQNTDYKRQRASVMTVSEIYQNIVLTQKNYSWFLVNHSVPVDYSCYSDSIPFQLNFGEGQETVYILDILNTFKNVAKD